MSSLPPPSLFLLSISLSLSSPLSFTRSRTYIHTHIHRRPPRPIDPRDIKMFVLDEADEMLSRGFKDQIYDVFRKLPSNIQVILLSATMPADVLEVTKRFMREPIRILVKKEELTLEGIKQFYIQVEKEVCMCVSLRAA